MKKTIGILLSILMVLNIIIPVYANTTGAALSSGVTIGTETVNAVKRGDTITLTVSMQDCDASFKSLGLTLAYDESVFEFVEKDVSGNANWTCPINGLFMSAYVAKNKNLATAAMSPINYNGVIFTINLNVKDTAVFGGQTISITPVIKNGQTVIPCSATSTTIEVLCNHVYADDWTSNAEEHYKECTIDGCTSKSNEAGHEWTHACDTDCNVCGYTREIEHPYDTTKWVTDGRTHWRVCSTEGCGATTDVGVHTGGMADCQTQAVCDICSQSFGELGGHTLTYHAEQGADHNNTGVAEHWTCDICNKYFSDAMGLNEIIRDDTIIGKVPHNHDSEWSYSTEKHWRECVCGDKIDVREHQFSNDCDTTCDCGYTRTIQHSWESTYSYNENGHWIECSVCGEKQGTVEIHKGGTATCQNKAECSICHQTYGEFAPHDMKEKVDATYLKSKANCVAKAVYYKSCSVCGAASTDTFETGKVDSATHTGKTEVKDAVKETCTADGYSGDIYCKDCGEKLEDGKVVQKGHKTNKVNAVSATTEKDGNIEYFVCSGCDKLFSDVEATREITLADTIIKKQEVKVDNKLDDKKPASPKTFDSSMYIIWVALLFISISVFIGAKNEGKKDNMK